MKYALIISLIALSSCQKRGMDSASLFSREGHLKDKIACVNMIDSSHCSLKWDVAQELTSYLEKNLSRKDTLYVVGVKNEIALSSAKNPFASDTSWLKDHFCHMKYVVFTELLKHEQQHQESQLGDQLALSLRVRVFKNTPEGFIPILQEIVQESYMLPSLLTKTSLFQPTYQSQGYELSPIGSSHQKFIELVAARIRDYLKD